MLILFDSKRSQILGIKAMIFETAMLTTGHVIILLHLFVRELCGIHCVNYETSELGYAAHEI